MLEVGVDLSSTPTTQLTDDLARQAALLVTMGCGDECPVVPGAARDDWPLEDPKGKPMGDVRAIRDAIRDLVLDLIERHAWNRRS